MKKYSLVAAAVAAAVSAGAFAASPPPLTGTPSASNPTVSLIIAGSSAAQSAVVKAVQGAVCGGAANALTITSTGNGNFQSVSCFSNVAITTNGGTIPANTLITVYYRSEGGSVVGALPLVTGYQPFRLNLSDSSCTAGAGATTGSCAITGSSASNGTNDSFSGAVTHGTVQLGVTDVEPAQLTNADFPSNYSPSVWGITAAGGQAAVQTALGKLNTSPLLQQVFGIAVNATGLTLNSAAGGKINLSNASVANILNGTDTDWSNVVDAVTGAAVSSTSAAISVINREPGSGTRTSTNIYFFGYQCGTPSSIAAGSGALNFSTGDDLSAASKVNGSITYASIDKVQPGNSSGLTLVSLNGVTPSTLAAALGQYNFWYEATFVPNPGVSSSSQTGILSQFLQNAVPLLANAPQQADVNVIPGAGSDINGNGNASGLPLSNAAFTAGTGSSEIYINPYTRAGNSCNAPAATL
ncbi:MAG TPA: hypothetical protein VK700_20485 [Steroidobacteraceae bacterium]|jgi:ABC-type phosphate transport system substrate-binding protein|nr:hypothetical protein [Steroidobacteraceae bacterium]